METEEKDPRKRVTNRAMNTQSAFHQRGLEARCGENFPPHSDCVIGQCQCSAGYGCYSCNGGRTQCQPGPGSGECWT